MSDEVELSDTPKVCRIAIIGGGPGGLMTAYQLQQQCSLPFEATIYEASSRLGGKILTKQFESAPVAYEAGAAELYDYSQVGEDPLRELVDKLGLKVKPMSGTAVVIHDQMMRNLDDDPAGPA
jgi:protoporphyrinogen oxidase